MSAPAKLAIWFLILASTSVAGLWLLGSKKSLDETSLRIDAPPSEVFSWVTDAELKQKWSTGLIEVTPIDTDMNAVGAKSNMIVDHNNREVEFENCVLRNDQDRVFSVKSTSSQFVWTSVFTLEKIENDKTYFTYRVRTANRGIGKILAPFSRYNLQQKIESDARKLKELIEQSNQPAIPADGSLPVPETSEAATGA